MLLSVLNVKKVSISTKMRNVIYVPISVKVVIAMKIALSMLTERRRLMVLLLIVDLAVKIVVMILRCVLSVRKDIMKKQVIV